MKQTIAYCMLGLVLRTTTAHTSFEGFGGWWGGSGNIRVDSGALERLACSAVIRLTQPRTELAMQLRCTSARRTIVIATNLSTQGTVLSGTWDVSTHRMSGSVHGQVDGTNIEGTIVSPELRARISIARIDKRIAVTFEPSAPSTVPKITLVLVRDGS